MNYSELTKEELLKLVEEQEQKLNELTNPPQNDWHSWFYSLLMIQLHGFPSVKVEREAVLGAQPPRSDFVIVKEDDVVDLGLGVFRNFRKENIIEFKSPDDELSEDVLWKVVGYAGFYLSLKEISYKDLTLTIFRGSKPEKLFRYLGKCIVPGDIKGIYKVEGWVVDLPIQIVVTTELEGREYAGFRAISKSPALSDIEQIMKDVYKETDHAARKWYRDYLDLFSRLDSEMLEEAKRRDSDMAKSWREIFEVDKELENRDKERIAIMLRKGKKPEEIADFCDYPIELVREVEKTTLAPV